MVFLANNINYCLLFHVGHAKKLKENCLEHFNMYEAVIKAEVMYFEA